MGRSEVESRINERVQQRVWLRACGGFADLAICSEFGPIMRRWDMERLTSGHIIQGCRSTLWLSRSHGVG